MSSLGLDLGTSTIKIVQAKGGPKPEVQRVVEVVNTLGVALPSDEGTAAQLSQLIEATFNDQKLNTKDVRLALPEQLVSTKVVEMPPLSDAELASAIGWQAEQHIPIPLEELALEYQVLYRPPKNDHTQKMRVLMVGARKQAVESYVNLFINIGIEPTHLETQTIASVRSLGFTLDDPATMVADIGATTMDLALVRRGEIAFVFSHLNGGQMLSKTVQQAIGLDTEQAEQYKRTFGLKEDQLEGKLRAALEPSVKILVSEMQKANQFFANHYPGEQVKRVLLAGGSAQLPGLVEYVTNQLNVEVLVAAPFGTATGEIPQANHPAFTVCMGLVMQE